MPPPDDDSLFLDGVQVAILNDGTVAPLTDQTAPFGVVVNVTTPATVPVYIQPVLSRWNPVTASNLSFSTVGEFSYTRPFTEQILEGILHASRMRDREPYYVLMNPEIYRELRAASVSAPLFALDTPTHDASRGWLQAIYQRVEIRTSDSVQAQNNPSNMIMTFDQSGVPLASFAMRLAPFLGSDDPAAAIPMDTRALRALPRGVNELRSAAKVISADDWRIAMNERISPPVRRSRWEILKEGDGLDV